MKYTKLFLTGICLAGNLALADNPLTEDQLMKATQLSLQDYASTQPQMTPYVTGFMVTTVGSNAQVSINMDTMSMTAKYLCIPQGPDITCHFQQF